MSKYKLLKEIEFVDSFLYWNDGSWDLWFYNKMIYSIACAGSGASCSSWCMVSDLRKHLYYLRNICGYVSLIPPSWENVNYDLLIQYGIN